MGYSPAGIGRWALKEQTGWGTAETTPVAADVLDIDKIVLPPLTQEAVQSDTMRAGYHEATIVAGSKAGVEVTIAGPLHGFSTATPSADPTEHLDAMLLRYALGDNSIATYETDLTSGGTTTTIDVTATGADGNSGHALLVGLTGSSDNGIGWVSDHTTNTYTVSTMPAAPDSSGNVYGSNTVYLSLTSPANGLTLQWLGADGNSAARLWDGAVSGMKLTLDAKGQPRHETTLRFLAWTNDGTGGTPSPAAHSFPQLPVAIGANGARLMVGGSSKGVGPCSLSIEVELAEVPDHSGNQGASQLVVTNRMVTLEVEGATSDASSLAAPGDSAGVIQLDLNTTPGRALSVFFGAAVIKASEELTDGLGGQLGTKNVYGVGLYTGDTETTAPADTSFRVAFL